MSTGYRWEGIIQVRAALLGACHVPEHLCGGRVQLGRYIKCSTYCPVLTTVRSLVVVECGCDEGL